MFKVRTSRTLLTVLGMGIGISAILFLVSLGFGIQKTLLETITTADSLVSLEVFSQKEEQPIDIQAFETINQLDGVVHTSPVVITDSQIRLSDRVAGAKAVVTDAEFLKLDGKDIYLGEGLSEYATQNVVVSTALVKLFGQSEKDIIGKEVTVNVEKENPQTKEKESFELKEHYVIAGLIEGEEEMLYLNQKGVRELASVSQYSRLKVKCKNSNVLNSIREQIVGLGFSTTSLSDIVDQANKVFEVVRIILAFFGVIALFVSAIGMFNTMTVTLLERTEEIGIMKSIGASDKNILSMFIFESTIMGFLGGISGIIIGIMTSQLINFIINIIAKNLGGNAMTLFNYPGWFLIFILISATVVGFLTGIVPARRASLINPLDALRYK